MQGSCRGTHLAAPLLLGCLPCQQAALCRGSWLSADSGCATKNCSCYTKTHLYYTSTYVIDATAVDCLTTEILMATLVLLQIRVPVQCFGKQITAFHSRASGRGMPSLKRVLIDQRGAALFITQPDVLTEHASPLCSVNTTRAGSVWQPLCCAWSLFVA